MRTRSDSFPPRALRKARVLGLIACACLAPPWRAGAALQSGVYQTVPGATAEERGDRVPSGLRTVPLSAIFTFDLEAATPSLTAALPNAVLEGGDPFALTVRSSSGTRSADGSYRFTGDYLREITPGGTQYGFDWRFSTGNNGSVLWSGITAWGGGHLWLVTISDVPLSPASIPEPGALGLVALGLGVALALRLKNSV